MLDKTYRPAETEAKLYDNWEDSGAFGASVESNANPYVVMMPPPNVTGSLHMGHALNMTLQDVLIRYQRRRGKDALWQPGSDHAGIATQMVVERQLGEEGKSRHDLGREGFLDRVWDWKAESGGTITRQLRRLGASPDWTRERFTMDEGLNRAVRRVFVKLHKEGLIFRDKRLVNWDPKLHTAISDLEVEQREVKGKLWHLRYPLQDDPEKFIVVATTRPETMLGDTGVAVHPDDDRYTDLVGNFVTLPLVGRSLPVVADEYADPETGSGAVKMTPAHDFNDFEVGRRHNLEMINIFDHNACLNDQVPEAYRGLDRYAARDKVLADLEAAGLIDRIDEHAHTVPHGDRSGVAIEPWLTDQWYCDAATLAKPAIEAVEQGRTVFVPKTWENTYFEWMRNIQPWCISRQLWWGHQIPAWYGPDGSIFVEETEEEARIAARQQFGHDVTLERDSDVLDTWFSSALWPFSTLGWPDEVPEVARYYPGDVLVTGFDIIFFWVARMMMMGLHFMGDVPFRTVYINALVLGPDGKKQSKTRGNTVDPLEMIEKFGADSLRFTLISMAAQGRNMIISKDRIQGYRNFTTKLWNAARYCQMNECRPRRDFDPAACTLTVNKWIVSELAATAGTVSAALDTYQFNDAATALYQFTWHNFCDWYLEFTKPVLLDGDKDVQDETRAATAWVLDQIVQLLNPIMPFVTEELWQQLSDDRDSMLISSPWPEYPDTLVNSVAGEEMGWVVRLISSIRAVRAEMNVPAGAKIPMLLKDAGKTSAVRLETHKGIITRLARLESAEPADGQTPKGAVQEVLDEATILLPLEGIVDFAQERARLEKEVAKFATEITKIDKKLGNKQFLAKAPEEVVEEQRHRKAGLVGSQARLTAALGRLTD